MPQEDADTGKGYQHSEQVQTQIANLPPLGSEDFWLRAQAPENDAETHLAAETLVYCLRQFMARGDAPSARRVAELLLPRCKRTVLKHAWIWFSTSEEDRNDMRQEVHCQLWKELRDPTERYWEVRFYHALKCLCYDVAKRLSQVGEGEEPWPRYVDEEGILIEIDIEDPDLVDPDEWIFMQQNLGRLDEPVRTAVYLRDIEEWPIHSQDPSVVTISRMLRVTDRTVRNYLNTGRAKLREWYVKEAGYATTD